MLQQQAQFWAVQQSLQESSRLHDAQIGALTDRVGEFVGHVGDLTSLMLRLGRIVEKRGEQMARTHEQLNSLIATVDRFISRHDGNA